MMVLTWTFSRHIQHAVPVTTKLKLTYHLKPSLKQGNGEATGHSQGFMTNQFSKKNSIVFSILNSKKWWFVSNIEKKYSKFKMFHILLVHY